MVVAEVALSAVVVAVLTIIWWKYHNYYQTSHTINMLFS